MSVHFQGSPCPPLYTLWVCRLKGLCLNCTVLCYQQPLAMVVLSEMYVRPTTRRCFWCSTCCSLWKWRTQVTERPALHWCTTYLFVPHGQFGLAVWWTQSTSTETRKRLAEVRNLQPIVFKIPLLSGIFFSYGAVHVFFSNSACRTQLGKSILRC